MFVIALPTADATPKPTPKPDAEADPGVDAPTDRHHRAEPERRTLRLVERRRPPSATPDATPEATPKPTAEPTPEPTPVSTPVATPTPTSAIPTNLAIVKGVKVVGESAAYSPDGAWFAFTARPSKGDTGPDIYVWRVGDDLARRLTDDHASVFGSWVGNRVARQPAVGLRPAVTLSDRDRSTSIRRAARRPPIPSGGWRPVVDPDDHWAIVWDGTVKVDQDNGTPMPAAGGLVLRKFSRSGGIDADGPAVSVVDGAVTEFDVRWDETGDWLAIWVADATIRRSAG